MNRLMSMPPLDINDPKYYTINEDQISFNPDRNAEIVKAFPIHHAKISETEWNGCAYYTSTLTLKTKNMDLCGAYSMILWVEEPTNKVNNIFATAFTDSYVNYNVIKTKDRTCSIGVNIIIGAPKTNRSAVRDFIFVMNNIQNMLFNTKEFIKALGIDRHDRAYMNTQRNKSRQFAYKMSGIPIGIGNANIKNPKNIILRSNIIFATFPELNPATTTWHLSKGATFTSTIYVNSDTQIQIADTEISAARTQLMKINMGRNSKIITIKNRILNAYDANQQWSIDPKKLR
eukprot:922337_1